MSIETVGNLAMHAFLSGKGISRIRVESLFGEYNYTVETRITMEGCAPRVILLYGENGAGKTTILNIIFYLLSQVDKVGHKTKIMRFPFKKIVIDFAEGTSVAATRPNAVEGSYTMSVSKNGALVAETEYGRERQGLPVRERFLQEKQHDDEHSKILAALESLKIRIVFLRHTRKILTTMTGGEKVPAYIIDAAGRHRLVRDGDDDDDDEDRIQGLNLQSTVFKVNRWATEQAIRGTTRGDEDVNELFSQIISQLALGDGASQGDALESLVADLMLQRDRYLLFSAFGLVSPLRLEPLLNALKTLPALVHPAVIQVLSPYVASLRARLDALEPVRARFATFVDMMNSFYRNKKVSLHVSRGLSIKTRNGEILKTPRLSSGESQLLYLLINVLVVKDKSSIFIVDEPEISLNVKWQRQLLKSLLTLTQESDIQFIFATHSIELLSRNREFVAQLNSQE